MISKIITKRGVSVTYNKLEQAAYQAACATEKNAFLKLRLYKKKDKRIKHANKGYRDTLIAENFRKHWFCKNCFLVFSLKPFRKYKILQVFQLRCRKCGSKNVAHNELLCMAIIDKKTQEELLRLSQENKFELGFEIDSYLKYPKVVSCTDLAKKISTEFIFSSK